MSAPEIPRERGPSRPYEVLVVGNLNTCRSPAAALLLDDRLADGGQVAVTSAGLSAAVGQPVPGPLRRLLEEAGAPATGHVARPLDPDRLAVADLVLTVTRQERAEVLRHAPTALRRTFTLRELACIARAVGPDLPDGDVRGRLSALLEAAPPHRAPRDPTAVVDDDVLDDGRDERAQAAAFAQVLAAVDDLVGALRPDLGRGPPAGGERPTGHPTGHLTEPPTGPPTTTRVRTRPAAGRASRLTPRRRATRVALVTAGVVTALALGAGVAGLVVADRLDAAVERFPDALSP